MLSIINLTFKETFSKKIFLAFFLFSTLFILLLFFTLNLDAVDNAQTYISIFGQQVDNGESFDMAEVVGYIEAGIAVALYVIGLFFSLFATSSLIPSLIKTGNIDLILSKPISRTKILMGRVIGSISIVAFNIFYLVIASWLILSIKSGVWNYHFLYSGFIIMITYGALYSLVTLFGILTGGTALSFIITYAVIFISPMLTVAMSEKLAAFTNVGDNLFIQICYNIVPKISEIGEIMFNVARGVKVETLLPIWTTLAFGIFFMGVSVVIFKRKDF